MNFRESKSGWMLSNADARQDGTDEGPASPFRDAVTDGAGVWGPILGGVVVVGGGIALVGTLLKDQQQHEYNPDLECPSRIGADSCAPHSSTLHTLHE